MNETIYHKPLNFKNLLVFVIPTMLMTVIQSLYSMIDGVFVSNLIGTEALSALSLIAPFFSILMAIATMLASGGSAVVMKKMGERKAQEANEDFTMLILINILIGIVLTLGGTAFVSQLSGSFGASPEVTAYCQSYLSTYIAFIIPELLFSNILMYVIAAGGSKLAMISSLFGGVFNIVFDFVFIKLCGFGMMGAALASGLGMMIPCLMIVAYFFNKKRMLHFVRPKFRGSVLTQTLSNGVSEFFSNLVSGVVMLLFNRSMLHYAGENGVAASTIIFYVFSFMNAVYMGYMLGTSPMFSYFYGEQNREKLGKLKALSLKLIGVLGIATTILTALSSQQLVGIFTSPDNPAYAMALHGNQLFSAALLIAGFNTFSSALFTALGNGLVSAVISFSRTFVLLAGCILILPIFLGIDGLWLSVPVAECMALVLSVCFVKKYQTKYGY